jgi:hypothetical protein
VLSDLDDGTLRFEIVSTPKHGVVGWNNSLAGTFIYSPRDTDAKEDVFKFRGDELLIEKYEMCDATWEPLTFVLCCAAVNRYGESNWARVVITIKHDNRESKLLKLCIVIAAIMLTASFCGLIRQANHFLTFVLCCLLIMSPL